jgi:hypothetical protein
LPDQSTTRCCAHHTHRHGRVEGDEAQAVPDRQAEQPGVGHLAVAEQLVGIEMLFVEQAHITGHEQVVLGQCGFAQALRHAGGRQRVRVTRLRHDAHAAVLRDRARRPAELDVLGQPRGRALVVQVVGIEQRNQHAHVEQCAARLGLGDRFRRALRLHQVFGLRLAHADLRTLARHHQYSPSSRSF